MSRKHWRVTLTGGAPLQDICCFILFLFYCPNLTMSFAADQTSLRVITIADALSSSFMTVQELFCLHCPLNLPKMTGEAVKRRLKRVFWIRHAEAGFGISPTLCSNQMDESTWMVRGAVFVHQLSLLKMVKLGKRCISRYFNQAES